MPRMLAAVVVFAGAMALLASPAFYQAEEETATVQGTVSFVDIETQRLGVQVAMDGEVTEMVFAVTEDTVIRRVDDGSDLEETLVLDDITPGNHTAVHYFVWDMMNVAERIDIWTNAVGT